MTAPLSAMAAPKLVTVSCSASSSAIFPASNSTSPRFGKGEEIGNQRIHARNSAGDKAEQFFAVRIESSFVPLGQERGHRAFCRSGERSRATRRAQNGSDRRWSAPTYGAQLSLAACGAFARQ